LLSETAEEDLAKKVVHFDDEKMKRPVKLIPFDISNIVGDDPRF
jgi:hypothetical protein